VGRDRDAARRMHYIRHIVGIGGKVMGMDATLTVTSKGQTTLPVAIRRLLGLADTGGVLRAHLNEDTGELTLTKPPSLADLSERISRHIKPGTRPLLDVAGFYQSRQSQA
jgi:bifunctional DNA-binding transcriptional regulator/antitoxin component of YhaV-PrlF toxin-antitoxin module